MIPTAKYGAKNKYMIPVDGIYSNKEFYSGNLSNSSASEPEYLSTLYWKHELSLHAGQLSTISLYTGDITGRFRVIVQGITATDVVYGEYFFDVKN